MLLHRNICAFIKVCDFSENSLFHLRISTMKFYLLILLFFILPIYSQANIVFVTNSIQPIQKQFNLSYAKYVIKSNINLMSQNVVIPEGAVLCFVDSGRIEMVRLLAMEQK